MTTPHLTVAAPLQAPYDVARVREDFPALRQLVHGKPLVYLDNAATTQKPRQVIDAYTKFYAEDCANIHRGVHLLSERATASYEGARKTIQRFLNARSEKEVIFVRGATEGINLVASTYGRRHVQEGDEVLISAMEHHSNIVPWQMLCEEKGAKLKVVPIDDSGALDMDAFSRLLGARTKLVAISQMSNALGTVNPVAEIIRQAHAQGVPVLLDGAQAAPHLGVDVQALDVDFYVFSGHKIYAPTGVGILYGKQALLEAMPPYQGGGDMIRTVSFEKTTYNDLPYKFEAGTPHIAGGIGLGAAIQYVQAIGLEKIAAWEHALLAYGTRKLLEVPGLRLVGTAPQKASVLSFVLEGVHPHDIGTIVDREGVAIRTGHHCAQPVMDRFGIPATARASLALYNTPEELDVLAAALHKAIALFR